MDDRGKSGKRLTLVDMERKLLDDSDGSYRRELLEKIKNYQQFVRGRLAQGLSPEEFSVYDQLKKALDASSEIFINFK